MPLLFHFISSFLFFAKEGKMTVCRRSVRLQCETGKQDEESRLWSVPVCHQRFLQLEFIHLIQSVGVWPPQSIFSIPACLQLVSSDRWLLIFLRGVRVRHEPYSYDHIVKLQKTLEKGHLVSAQLFINPQSLYNDQNCTNYPPPQDCL